MGTPLELFYAKTFRGTPLAICVFGSEFSQGDTPCDVSFWNLFYAKTFRETPHAIFDFGICFMQKPLGGRPLRFMILGFVLCKNL